MDAWTWLAIGTACWLALSLVVGVTVGRMFARADEEQQVSQWTFIDIEWDWPPR